MRKKEFSINFLYKIIFITIIILTCLSFLVAIQSTSKTVKKQAIENHSELLNTYMEKIDATFAGADTFLASYINTGDDVIEQVNILIKYDGYIKRQIKQVEQFKRLEKKKLPQNFDYAEINGLRIEAVQKLNKYQPMNIGQASRISGVSPADTSVILVYLEQLKYSNPDLFYQLNGHLDD